MLLRTLCLAVAALALAPAAHADGPALGATEGGTGAASAVTGLRYVTLSGSSRQTMLATIRMRDGVVLGYSLLRGFWGVPAVTYDGSTSGLSADGSTLVLVNELGRPVTLQTSSTFAVIDVTRMAPPTMIKLHGDFSFDALSPRGDILYLIQHVSQRDLTRYIVRAYDLRTRRFWSRVIADRTQPGWVMSGYPLHRVTSADGRWVYTLYTNDGGTPFVHARTASGSLGTARRTVSGTSSFGSGAAGVRSPFVISAVSACCRSTRERFASRIRGWTTRVEHSRRCGSRSQCRSSSSSRPRGFTDAAC